MTWEHRAFEWVMLASKLGAAALVVVGTALYKFQCNLIYPANLPSGSRQDVPTPPEFGMDQYEDVELEAPDGIKLKAYLILQGAEHGTEKEEAPSRPTVFLFHANAGNMGHRLPIARVFYKNLKCNVFMLSYRGYGKSQGTANEKGIRMDAQTALDFVLSHPLLEKTSLILYGQSLGGAVAFDVASRNENRIHGIVVENTFWSLPELVPHVMPYVTPFLMLLHQKWETGKLVTEFRKDLPILFLSGSQDELVPPSHMESLHDKCSSELKVLKVFDNGTHNDTCVQPGYFEFISHFIKSRILGEKEWLGQPSPEKDGVPDPEKSLNESLDEDLRAMMESEPPGSIVPGHPEES